MHANGWIGCLKMDFGGKMVSPVVQSSRGGLITLFGATIDRCPWGGGGGGGGGEHRR